jgi:hypothetical protein
MAPQNLNQGKNSRDEMLRRVRLVDGNVEANLAQARLRNGRPDNLHKISGGYRDDVSSS